MSYRNGNYCAFYVDEPFSESNLGAYSTPDFNNYQLLRMWKTKDVNFPFNDSHQKNYNVRDGSLWESTLKPRLRERLRNSKNIVLFLSSHTKPSKALNEEIEYGIGTLGLPVIVVYPDFAPIRNDGTFDTRVFGLWEKLPAFSRLTGEVPTIHIPLEKASLTTALRSRNFMVLSKAKPGKYRL